MVLWDRSCAARLGGREERRESSDDAAGLELRDAAWRGRGAAVGMNDMAMRKETRQRRRPRKEAGAASGYKKDGHELQRYSDSTRSRIVVGYIPYCASDGGEVEVLKKGLAGGMLIPKGRWELDKSMDEAARREAAEEAGVVGETGPTLGRWCYRSRSYDATYEGFVLPLHVTAELHRLPRRRQRPR
ncbi:hypothetical protein SETIT_1G283600v2 [Setaria italica]|uniref:Nudix hydrolase domain-containing protein n=1 Tax=Setaria italica TaxID=4555 RepID=A0A368PQI5_SETIT|nr:hypothetical protein SETIT_1G283600v2 [Setaria italica]